MKPLSRMIALLASVAHLLAACSNATVNRAEPASTDAAGKAPHASTDQLAQSASTSPQFVNEWPPGTPDLRDVIFEFTVTGDKTRVLSDDGSVCRFCRDNNIDHINTPMVLLIMLANGLLCEGVFRVKLDEVYRVGWYSAWVKDFVLEQYRSLKSNV